MNRVYYFFLVFCFSISCKNSSIKKKKNTSPYKKQWINPILLNEPFQNELNFPYWFCDSILEKNRVFQITRRIYPEIDKDSNGHFVLPKEKYIYTFNKKGEIIKLDFFLYQDSKEVTFFSFLFKKKRKKNDFYQVQVLPPNSTYQKFKDAFKVDLYNDATHHFDIYQPFEKRKKYNSYLNIEHKNKLFIIKNKKYFGTLSIDSILHPNMKDWVVLGNIKNPYKRFQNEQIVKIKNEYHYFYSPNRLLTKRILKQEPFEYHRHFLYTSNSIWISSIDSIFSDNQFITQQKTQITYDPFQRPKRITISNQNEDNKKEIIHLETFSYRIFGD